jgi:hypothetical protein
LARPLSELLNGRNGDFARNGNPARESGMDPAESWLRNWLSYGLWQARQRAATIKVKRFRRLSRLERSCELREYQCSTRSGVTLAEPFLQIAFLPLPVVPSQDHRPEARRRRPVRVRALLSVAAGFSSHA